MLINLRLIAKSIRKKKTTLLLLSCLINVKIVGLCVYVTLHLIYS
jgi:hypothetical protein